MTLVTQSLLRTAFLSCVLIVLGLVSLFHTCRHEKYGISNRALSAQQILSESKHSLHARLDLDEHECRAAFPELLNEIDNKIRQGSFPFPPSPADYKGLVQARIENNNLYILTTAPDTLPQILHQRTAVLAQIHRALLTSPTTLPNTTFAFAINDVPKNNTWGFSRPNKNSSYNVWLMPLFSSWSWPKPSLGPLDAILHRITRIENNLTWADKHDKVVWRGTPWFNPLGHPNLRKDLVKATKDKEWADVSALEGGDDRNAIQIEEFCKYKYIVYTEGVTYSGRLPYHQACESVLIMAPMTWVTTTAMMIRPIQAEDLLRGTVARGAQSKKDVSGVGALSMVDRFEDANAVYVQPDFSDLEKVVAFLRKHQGIAQRIARNQRKMMQHEGNLGISAEVCYWRALIRAWADVARIEHGEWAATREERYETWLLKEITLQRQNSRSK